MKILSLILLCVAHNAAPKPYGDDIGRIGKHESHHLHRNSMKYDEVHPIQYPGKQERRLFELIKQILRNKNKTKTEIMDENFRFRQVEANLTEVLTHLSSVLNQILNLVKYTKQDSFHGINEYLPNDTDRNLQRIKRSTDPGNETVTETTVVENVTEATNTSGRRVLAGQMPITTDEIRKKLFLYIEEGFNEISNKVNSLEPIRTAFNNDVSYKIGYIVANIDTLDASMKNMKADMDHNKYNWDDYKILNLYDTIKTATRAVSNLMDVLKDYLEKGFN